MLARRSFLTGLVSALTAPAIVRAGSLMPVKALVIPPRIGGYEPEICEMLSQCNDYTDDPRYMEANENTGHEFVFQTSIPAGTWRRFNDYFGSKP